jgi:hypothetical protein
MFTMPMVAGSSIPAPAKTVLKLGAMAYTPDEPAGKVKQQ